MSLPGVNLFYRWSRSREGTFKFVFKYRWNIWPKHNVFTILLSVGSFVEHVYNEMCWYATRGVSVNTVHTPLTISFSFHYTYICTYIHMYLHTYICTCIRTYMYAYIHIVRTYIHTYIFIPLSLSLLLLHLNIEHANKHQTAQDIVKYIYKIRQ